MTVNTESPPSLDSPKKENQAIKYPELPSVENAKVLRPDQVSSRLREYMTGGEVCPSPFKLESSFTVGSAPSPSSSPVPRSIEPIEKPSQREKVDVSFEYVEEKAEHESLDRKALDSNITPTQSQISKKVSSSAAVTTEAISISINISKSKEKRYIACIEVFQNNCLELVAYLEALDELLKEEWKNYNKGLHNTKEVLASLKDLEKLQRNLRELYEFISDNKGRFNDYEDSIKREAKAEREAEAEKQAKAEMQPSKDMQSSEEAKKKKIKKRIYLTRFFRQDIFPPLNALRLTFLVRIEKLVKYVAFLSGSPLSQGIVAQISTAFAWTGLLGWIFYLPRIISNLAVSIHNVRRSFKMKKDQGDVNFASKSWHQKWKLFFTLLWKNTSERVWQHANDVVWAVVGLITCFCPPAIFLTPLLYVYDIIIELFKHLRIIKMWKLQARYAAQGWWDLTQNKRVTLGFSGKKCEPSSRSSNVSSTEAVSEKPELERYWDYGPQSDNSKQSVSGKEVDLDHYATGTLIPVNTDLTQYQRMRFLKGLYVHICLSILSVNNINTPTNTPTDISLSTVDELHRRAFTAWIIHVSTIKEKAQTCKDQITAVYRHIKRCPLILKHTITGEMKKHLNRTDEYFKVALKNVENGTILNAAHNPTYKFYKKMNTKVADAEQNLRERMVVTGLFAVGMITGFLTGGIIAVCPFIPSVAIISFGLVFVTSITAFIHDRVKAHRAKLRGKAEGTSSGPLGSIKG